MKEFIFQNWQFLLIGVIVIAAVVYSIIKQPSKIKSWLLLAVTEAEKQLGGGTGLLKLERVYEAFIKKYPLLAALLPFSVFSAWVDEVLDIMREILTIKEDNEKIEPEETQKSKN